MLTNPPKAQNDCSRDVERIENLPPLARLFCQRARLPAA
jgi:hypothetical protein